MEGVLRQGLNLLSEHRGTVVSWDHWGRWVEFRFTYVDDELKFKQFEEYDFPWVPGVACQSGLGAFNADRIKKLLCSAECNLGMDEGLLGKHPSRPIADGELLSYNVTAAAPKALSLHRFGYLTICSTFRDCIIWVTQQI